MDISISFISRQAGSDCATISFLMKSLSMPADRLFSPWWYRSQFWLKLGSFFENDVRHEVRQKARSAGIANYSDEWACCSMALKSSLHDVKKSLFKKRRRILDYEETLWERSLCGSVSCGIRQGENPNLNGDKAGCWKNKGRSRRMLADSLSWTLWAFHKTKKWAFSSELAKRSVTDQR